MIKLGVFILPNKKLKNKILLKKKDIKKRFGNQKYLSHPPHCTLCVINSTNKSLNLIKKNEVFTSRYKREFKIEKSEIFFNDPITKGNTLIFKIKKNNFLKNLQLQICNKLKKYTVKDKKKFKNILMKKNYQRFGYPFVNTNWQPHFTIASISKSSRNKIYLQNFKNEKFNKINQKISYIFFFRIKENNHKLICSKKII